MSVLYVEREHNWDHRAFLFHEEMEDPSREHIVSPALRMGLGMFEEGVGGRERG